MSRWRFLLTPRWAGYLLLVVAFAVVCCALGTWQFNRRAEALTEIQRIDANYDHAPVPLGEALPDPDGFDADQRWLVVTASGEYLADEQAYVRNRPFGGGTGYQVITPFRTDDGTVLMIDRGWVAQDQDGRPSEAAPPPSGDVEVIARLKAGEGRIAGRTSSGDEIATIDLHELAGRVGEPSYTGAYGVLVQDAADAAEPPLAAARPVRDEGPHLSYALQWFVFALLGFVGLAWAANQERRALVEASGTGDAGDGARTATDAPAGASRRTQVRASRRSRRDVDADAEDGILDHRP